jgi:hypothetical protein
VRTFLSSLNGNASRFEPLWITVLWCESAFRDAYSRHVPSSVESAVRRPPAPPPIALCSTFSDWQPLRKRPLWTCQAPKIVGLDIGLTSNFCSRDMRQIRRRMRHPSTCRPKFGVTLECQPLFAGMPVDDQYVTVASGLASGLTRKEC